MSSGSSKGGKVLNFQRETTEVDRQTGEITKETTTNVYKMPSEPPYVKLYIEDLSHLLNLKDHHAALILELIKKMDFENVITLTPSARDRISEKLKIQAQTFRNYLNELLKRDVFRRIGHNEFKANPELFARGSWTEIYERQQAFKMIVTYSPKGRNVTTELEPEQEELFPKE